MEDLLKDLNWNSRDKIQYMKLQIQWVVLTADYPQQKKTFVNLNTYKQKLSKMKNMGKNKEQEWVVGPSST